MYLEVKQDGSVFPSGYQYDIWTYFEQQSNYSTRYVKSIDGSWGSLNPDGTFNGMIGMLERGEVDCAVSAFGLLKSRAKAADFLDPYETIKSVEFLIQ